MSVINTNITSLIAQKNLNASQSALTTAMERLSSGMRINSAKDDAAGQAIANRMSSQITGLGQAQRNANDGISVAQTAEGALNQINDNLQRVRELTVQAQNGTNSDEDLTSIQAEINQRLGEINRISEQTDFNGTKVLSEDQTLAIQVGANDGESISINLRQINAETLDLTGFNVDGTGETPNEAATDDDLILAGFTKGSTPNTNGSYTYTKTETVANTAATASNVFGKAATADTVTYTGTDSGFGVAATGNSYTYDSTSNSYSFDAQDVAKTDLATYLTPSAGATKAATVTIGGTAQDILINSDGSITAADDGATLYLDSTGNLTKNSAGLPPAATLDNLMLSMSGEAAPGAAGVVTVDGVAATSDETATVTFTALTAGQSVTVGDVTLTASGDLSANDVAAAFNSFIGSDTATTNATFSDADTDTVITTAVGTSLKTDWSPTGLSGNTLEFTSTTATTNVANLTTSVSGTTGTNGTIEVGDTTFAADTVNNAFDVTDATIGSDQLRNLVQTNGGSVTLLNGTDPDVIYDIAAGGAVTVAAAAQYVEADGDLTGTANATTTTTYYAHTNGNVTDDTGAQVYKEEDGDFTFSATTAGTATEDPLTVLDSALKQIDSLRSDLGAIQNRFDSAISNLSTTTTNLSAARSRIEDADYAVEVANMTKAQILQQAGTSVLAQANQIPQGVLSLLG